MTIWSFKASRTVRLPESRTRVLQPRGGQLVDQFNEFVQAAGLDRHRRRSLLGDGDHGVGVGFRGPIKQGPGTGAGLGPGGENLGVLAHQDQAFPVALAFYPLHEGLEFGRVPRIRFDRHEVRFQGKTHPMVAEVLQPLEPSPDLGLRHLVGNQDGDPRWAHEPLFMAEQDRLAPGFKSFFSGADAKGPDRGRGSRVQLRLGLFGNERAGAEFRLPGGQLHGKSQTGRDPAFSTIGLRQFFKNFDSGKGHGLLLWKSVSVSVWVRLKR